MQKATLTCIWNTLVKMIRGNELPLSLETYTLHDQVIKTREGWRSVVTGEPFQFPEKLPPGAVVTIQLPTLLG